MKTRLWYIVALAATFIGGWWLGQYVSRPEIVERVRVDTVFYERPKPFAVTERPVAVNVPRMLFAPADTVNRTIVVGDSVQITVTERMLEYRDSTYYARVVGPVVGPLGPRLDFIETYNKTVERVQLVREPYAWELGPALGAWMTSVVFQKVCLGRSLQILQICKYSDSCFQIHTPRRVDLIFVL